MRWMWIGVMMLGLWLADPVAAQGVGGASVPVDQLITLSGKQAGWRGLYPGKSRIEDMKSVLGEPATSEKEDDGTTRHVFPPGESIKFNSVYVNQDGVVTTIGWALFEPTTYVSGRDLWRLLGEPVVLSPTSHEPGAAVYRWPDACVWGVIRTDRSKILSIVFHAPGQKPKYERSAEPVQ